MVLSTPGPGKRGKKVFEDKKKVPVNSALSRILGTHGTLIEQSPRLLQEKNDSRSHKIRNSLFPLFPGESAEFY
jgi:hypothetical protein